jgi:hypothetical protein
MVWYQHFSLVVELEALPRDIPLLVEGVQEIHGCLDDICSCLSSTIMFQKRHDGRHPWHEVCPSTAFCMCSLFDLLHVELVLSSTECPFGFYVLE